MYFRQKVLDKYRNNELCKIGDNYISLLRYDKMTAASTVNFVNRNFVNIDDNVVLMVQAQDYIYVPPRERRRWKHYEIPESQIQF
jgi:hypothetical protein